MTKLNSFNYVSGKKERSNQKTRRRKKSNGGHNTRINPADGTRWRGLGRGGGGPKEKGGCKTDLQKGGGGAERHDHRAKQNTLGRDP